MWLRFGFIDPRYMDPLHRVVVGQHLQILDDVFRIYEINELTFVSGQAGVLGSSLGYFGGLMTSVSISWGGDVAHDLIKLSTDISAFVTRALKVEGRSTETVLVSSTERKREEKKKKKKERERSKK